MVFLSRHTMRVKIHIKKLPPKDLLDGKVLVFLLREGLIRRLTSAEISTSFPIRMDRL